MPAFLDNQGISVQPQSLIITGTTMHSFFSSLSKAIFNSSFFIYYVLNKLLLINTNTISEEDNSVLIRLSQFSPAIIKVSSQVEIKLLYSVKGVKVVLNSSK